MLTIERNYYAFLFIYSPYQSLNQVTLKYLESVHIVSVSMSMFLRYSWTSGIRPGNVPLSSFSRVSAPPLPTACLPINHRHWCYDLFWSQISIGNYNNCNLCLLTIKDFIQCHLVYNGRRWPCIIGCILAIIIASRVIVAIALFHLEITLIGRLFLISFLINKFNLRLATNQEQCI